MSLKHFLTDEHRRALRIKRGRLIPLEELRNAEVDIEPSDPSTAERIYERRWTSTLLDHVFVQLKDCYHKAGNTELFDCLKQLLAEGPEAVSQADVEAKRFWVALPAEMRDTKDLAPNQRQELWCGADVIGQSESRLNCGTKKD